MVGKSHAVLLLCDFCFSWQHFNYLHTWSGLGSYRVGTFVGRLDFTIWLLSNSAGLCKLWLIGISYRHNIARSAYVCVCFAFCSNLLTIFVSVFPQNCLIVKILRMMLDGQISTVSQILCHLFVESCSVADHLAYVLSCYFAHDRKFPIVNQ